MHDAPNRAGGNADVKSGPGHATNFARVRAAVCRERTDNRFPLSRVEVAVETRAVDSEFNGSRAGRRDRREMETT